MALIQAARRRLRGPFSLRPTSRLPSARDESGVALFMVIAAMSVLAVLVTEFTYVAQVNQRMAFDGLDQLKAHYLAKTGLKLSLLRLKAYQNVKAVVTGGKGGAIPGVPKAMLDKIWSFPFFFPIPTNIPGLTPLEKDRIAAFEKESGLAGKFSAVIESESSKYNLNMILAPFAPPAPSASPSPSPTPPPVAPADGGQPVPAPQPQASPTPVFNPEKAREGLGNFLAQIYDNKVKADPDFGAEYRDFRMEDLLDNLVAYADGTYERRNGGLREYVPPKKAPFYSLSELRQIFPIDDRLYDLFAPNLTVSTTPGVNVNTMKEPTLRALIAGLTDEEVKDFFQFRDSEEEDNQFKTEDDFFKYLGSKTNAYRTPESVDELRKNLKAASIRIVTDESTFKITVMAQMNTATRILEAWVVMGTPGGKSTSSGAAGGVSTEGTRAPPAGGTRLFGGGPAEAGSAGLRITFMRFL